jgi:predicted dehydrogenase
MSTERAGPLRVGVLGAGPIAQFAHFDALAKARNAELYAICDLAEDLLAEMSAVHRPARTFTDYAAMLADPGLDAVVIATADQYHVPAARQAIQAGKHVLVEKPLGAATSECLPLRDEVRASGLRLQVGTMRRFDPGISFARDFVRDEIGELIALKAWYCDSAYRYQMTDTLQPVPRVSANARKPPGDPKGDRRRYYMLGHGSHLIDTARFLAGEEIVTVRADLAERAGAYCWFVSVEFASGALGHLDLTLSVQMDWHEGFQIYGEHGSVVAKGFLPWYHRASEVECFSSKDRRFHRPLGEDAHVWRRQVEGFADSILTGAAQLGANVDDGLAAMQVMDAIERSVATRATVTVDPTFAPA